MTNPKDQKRECEHKNVLTLDGLRACADCKVLLPSSIPMGEKIETDVVIKKILSMPDLRDPDTQTSREVNAHELIVWLQNYGK